MFRPISQLALAVAIPLAFATTAPAGDLPPLSLSYPPLEAFVQEGGGAADGDAERRWFDGQWPWKGFATGLRGGFETFPRPIGAPLFFEDPFINSDLRPVVLYHEFPESSLLGGGDLTVQAVQARLALTGRLQFVANSDGFADLEADNLPHNEGHMDLSLGFKYALFVEPETLSILSTGLGWRPDNGSRDVFQGTADEFHLYVSGATSLDKKLFLIGNVTGRITTHHGKGNDSLSWNFNASYELFEDFFPLIEYHGFVYTSNGDRLPVRDGLLDYGNLGASDVRGSSAHWGTLGLRWNFIEHASFGFGYGFALRHPSNNDILDRRITMNLIFTY